MLDEEVFNKGMAVLMAAYPDYKCTPETVDVYREYLQPLDNASFTRAVGLHIIENKWFPKVSELLEVSQPIEVDPQEVWGGLILAAERGETPDLDFATQRALDTVCGGWKKFCCTTYDELKFLLKNFKESYLHARAIQKQSQELLGGAPLPQIGEVDGKE